MKKLVSTEISFCENNNIQMPIIAMQCDWPFYITVDDEYLLILPACYRQLFRDYSREQIIYILSNLFPGVVTEKSTLGIDGGGG